MPPPPLGLLLTASHHKSHKLQHACTTLRELSLHWDNDDYDGHLQHHHTIMLGDLVCGVAFFLLVIRGHTCIYSTCTDERPLSNTRHHDRTTGASGRPRRCSPASATPPASCSSSCSKSNRHRAAAAAAAATGARSPTRASSSSPRPTTSPSRPRRPTFRPAWRAGAGRARPSPSFSAAAAAAAAAGAAAWW